MPPSTPPPQWLVDRYRRDDEQSWASDEPRPKAPEPEDWAKHSDHDGREFRSAADDLRASIREKHRRVEAAIDGMLKSLETSDLQKATAHVRRLILVYGDELCRRPQHSKGDR